MPMKRAGMPYREAPPSEVRECPLCDVDLATRGSHVCPRCGLWWMLPRDAGERVRTPMETRGDGAAIDLALRHRGGCEASVLLLVLAAFGFGSAYMIVRWTEIARGPLSLMLVALGLVSVVGLATAIWLGAVCAAYLARVLVQAVVPSRLLGDAATLRIRAWRDHDGLRGGFRRTDVTVPREHVTGVFIWRLTHAGSARLRLQHASGLAFDLSWQASEADVARRGEALAAWLCASPYSAGATSTTASSPTRSTA